MFKTKLSYLRFVAFLLCTALFLNQCHNSLKSWLWEPDIITISKPLDQEKTYEMPAISSCSYPTNGSTAITLDPETIFPYIGVGDMYGTDGYPLWDKRPNYSNVSAVAATDTYLENWSHYTVPGYLKCLTFHPTGMVGFGAFQGLHFLFRPSNFGGEFALLLYVHKKGFFLCSHQRRFGLNIIVLPSPHQDPSKLNVVLYSIQFQRRKKLPRKEYPCKKHSQETVNHCLNQYMKRKHNCSLMWDKQTPVVDPCQTANIHAISDTLTHLDKLTTFEMMDLFIPHCYLPCVEHEYTLEKVSERTEPCPKNRYPCTNLVGVEVNAPNTLIDVTEEKWLYTKDNFIADVGGYLGLLLGISVMGIYDVLVSKSFAIKETWRRFCSCSS